MSLYGALFSGVSGLSAQSDALSMIADNITNVNTVGYKRAQSNFSTLVTESATPTQYFSGGVQARPQLLVSSQGLLQAASDPTDLGIQGGGMFVVNTVPNPTTTGGATTGSYLFTRAGAFTPDSAGNLKNAAGLYLQGWPIAADGTIPSDQVDLTALKTVNINGLTGNATATTTLTLQANLQASAAAGITAETPIVSPASLAVTPTTALGTSTGLVNGNTFTITTGAGPGVTYTYESAPAGAGQFDTLQNLAAAINANTATTGLTATVTGTTNATISLSESDGTKAVSITGTLSGGAGTPLFTTTSSAATYTPGNLATGTITPQFQQSFSIFDSQGTTHTLNIAFAKDPTLGANLWRAEVYVTPPTDVNEALQPNGLVASGVVGFNSDGTLNTATTTLPGTVNVDWNASLGVANSTIALNIGSSGTASGLTQFDSPSTLISAVPNGTPFGAFTGITISSVGVVTGTFSNGTTRALYQLPLATFPNPDGLNNVTGDAFSESPAAGNVLLQKPTQGGAGTLQAGELESSNVDLGTEFSNMIATQQAYSAAGKIISTVNQMLQVLIQNVQ